MDAASFLLLPEYLLADSVLLLIAKFAVVALLGVRAPGYLNSLLFSVKASREFVPISECSLINPLLFNYFSVNSFLLALLVCTRSEAGYDYSLFCRLAANYELFPP